MLRFLTFLINFLIFPKNANLCQKSHSCHKNCDFWDKFAFFVKTKKLIKKVRKRNIELSN